jgi:hypothetical protein
MMNLDAELAAVQPGVTGYFEHDPLFGAFRTDGDIYYRKLPITDFFASGLPFQPIHIVIIGVGIVAVVFTVGLILFRRRKTNQG